MTPVNMRNIMLITLVLGFWTPFVFSAQPERTVNIHAWPLSETKSQSLAQITYTANNATVKSYTSPNFSDNDDIVRIGFHHPTGSWSGVATTASNFSPAKDKKIQLHLNTAGDLYHIGFVASSLPSSSKNGKGKQSGNAQDGLSVEVVRMQKGPEPHLNKPVVLSADGKVPQKEPEKSFLQK